MKYKVIGLMSGTSLDGLDIAFCEFEKRGGHWDYAIIQAETIPYTEDWHERLSTIEMASAFEYVATDVEFGHLSGQLTAGFMKKHNLNPDFIASHGHTIFHQPSGKITAQIGRGSAIAAETGVQVVCDFRSLDVALGGQGAPLVPIGDQLLFGHFDYCLNLGGFANISFQKNDQRIAFDICPVNIVLNRLSRMVGQEFDSDGLLADQGRIDESLLEGLNSLAFYYQDPPKSLGKEWVVEHIYPLLDQSKLNVNDHLATFCEHIAVQIAKATRGNVSETLMITGGGAFNTYLVERIGFHSKTQIIIPDNLTINYKEALIFAFLGVLRMRNEINCLASVTGARRDSSGGAVHYC
jgi:anhydro-N-acetylmuramic acid kinase